MKNITVDLECDGNMENGCITLDSGVLWGEANAEVRLCR